MTQELTLSDIFGEITKVLAENRQELDDADSYNHNHGSNIVQTFDLIQKAVASKESEPVSEQLAYASKVLKKQNTGGTAQIYADGLADASRAFVGKEFNASTASTLINAMMGTQGSSERGGGDILSTLLGSLTKPKDQETSHATAPTQPDDLFGSLIGSLGSQQQAPTTISDQPDAGDLLGGLLGGLTGSSGLGSQTASGNGGLGDLAGSLLGGQTDAKDDSGLDASDLISVGMAYFAAKQNGQSGLQAIMQALESASPLGKRQDQQQSGALIINTILNMLKK